MRLTRTAACRSLAGCLLTLIFAAPVLAQPATVLDLAGQQKNLHTFVAAVHTAGLDDTLKAGGPVTVYAPTDDAFAKLPDRAALLADPARLRAMLLGLIVKEAISMQEGESKITSGSIPSAAGRNLTFATDGDRTTVGGAHLVSSDLHADNGSLNTLDKVPLP